MSRTIKLTGVEIDSDLVTDFNAAQNCVYLGDTITIFMTDTEFSLFFSQYHAIKYGKNEQNKNG